MKRTIAAVLLVTLLLAVAGCEGNGGKGLWEKLPASKKKGTASYDKGYEEGYAKGYAKGNQDCIDGNEFNTKPSFNPGFDEQYALGYDVGYNAGYIDGFTDTETMKSEAEEESPPGTSEADDYELGSRDGYRVGYEHAKEDWVQGWGYYEPEPTEEFMDHYCYGRSDYYEEGWVDGFKEGYIQGWNEQAQPGSGT